MILFVEKMVTQELSDLFDKLSRELPPDVLDQVIFLIDDYLEAFEIPDDVSGQQMFDELHQHLGTRQMLQLLSEVFKAIGRMDLFMWIWNYGLLAFVLPFFLGFVKKKFRLRIQTVEVIF